MKRFLRGDERRSDKMKKITGTTWITCPACGRRWLVSKTVFVEFECYCGEKINNSEVIKLEHGDEMKTNL
ncbi:MAG: hypothetical protein QXU09_03675 [Thermoproteota archaeon]